VLEEIVGEIADEYDRDGTWKTWATSISGCRRDFDA